MRAPLPPNEPLRLAALHDLDILDTEAEPAFDDLVALATSLMEAPIGALSLTDETRQWFKAQRGLDLPSIERENSFCAHTILDRAPHVVPDLALDPRFADHPRVAGAPYLRSYAGAPMFTADGFCIGTLCVVDHSPRQWSPSQIENLQRLAAVALRQMELRRNASNAVEHAEQVNALAARETRYGLIVESMTEGVCVKDRSGKIVSANASAARILGLKMEQLLGRTSFDPRWRLLHEDGSDYCPEDHPANLALATGKRQHGAVMGVHTPPNHWKWIRINAVPVFEAADPDPVQVVVTFEDITQSREDRARLVANEERLELALSVAEAISWDSRADQDEIIFSGNIEQIFGDVPVKMTRNAFWDLVHPEDRDRAAKEYATRIARSRPVQIDYRILRSDGDVRWVRCYAGVDLDESGEPARSFGMILDITAGKIQQMRLAEALEAAESANLAKQAFLANMSHEIRTPLNGVTSAAGALAGLVRTEDERELTSIMVDSATLLERILSDLLDYSKIEAGKVEIVAAPFNLTDDLCATVRAARLGAEAKGLTFKVAVGESARGVYEGDLLRVKQILYNLLSNAVKFTDAGSIDLRVDAVDAPDGVTHLGFEVQDTGIGFDVATADRLFQRFVQADTNITRRFGGTGLGLAISRNLALLMGGDLQAFSEPGRGSTFRLRLPVRRVLRAPAPPVDTQVADATVAPGIWTLDGMAAFRVLLAEDNPVNQRVVGLILQSYGVDVTVAKDGREALDMLAATHFDLVLMDLQMPELDGLTATQHIRARERHEARPRTPVAILSANAMAHHVEAALAAGADRHIAKPFTPQSLIDGMRETMASAMGWTEEGARSSAA